MVLPYLVQKELKQILRNRLLPVIFVILPLALMNVLPRIATQEVRGIRFVVVDADHSPSSQRLAQRLDASHYLERVFPTTADGSTPAFVSHKEAMRLIDSGEADAIVEFARGYEKALMTGTDETIMHVSVNAVNGMKGSMAAMYITQIAASVPSEVSISPSGALEAVGVAPSLRFLYNPTLEYKIFMIPAIFALILILIVGFLPALNIVGEKERGTMEQINVSPIGKMTFILSKVIPYIIIGLLMTIEALVAARAIHGITPVGSVVTLMIFVVMFCMLAASIGLIISNYSSTLQQAALTMFFFLVIFILMSGLLTPIASMPRWAQIVTYLNPVRYIIAALRDVFIKGAGFADLLPQFIPLTLYVAAAWTWAIKSYKKSE